jgi:formylglycine-generating enzyme required for sulfatase activity
MGSEKGEYPSGPVTDPIGPESGEYRVLRGGSWGGGAWYLRSAFRDGYTPGNRFSLIGFRVARDLN